VNILLINYQQNGLTGWFPQALAAIASGQNNCEVIDYTVSKNFRQYDLTAFLNKNHFDVIGISSCAGYHEYAEYNKIAQAVNKSNSRKEFWFIAGGAMFTSEPEYFLDKFGLDSVMFGDGELLGEPPYDPLHKLGMGALDEYEMPAYSSFDIGHYRLMRMPNIQTNEYCLPILSSRGCTNKCSFCYRQDKGIRFRDIKNVVKEIEYLKRYYQISYFAFADELALATKRRAIELAEALMPLKIHYDMNARLDWIGKDSSEVLTILKKSGLIFLNFGVECYDNKVLAEMNKNLTEEQIVKGLEATLEAGISPGVNIIFGFPSDTPETLTKSLELLAKYDDESQLRTIRPVCAYPGTELYHKAIKEEKCNGPEDFYNNLCRNSDLLGINFTSLSDEDFHAYLKDANSFMIKRYFEKQKERWLKDCENLYDNQNANFKGYRSK